MKHVVATLAGLVLLGSPAAPLAWGATDATLSGVVRDAQGTPQMGALVELLGPDASVIERAFTDDHGRYLLRSVTPGSYRLRASAAFLVPVVRANVRLRAGVQAAADLTMTALFQAGAWLPAQRRPVGEPTDDWQWTLRSTASRPLLRLVSDGEAGEAKGISSSADRSKIVLSEGQIAVLAGDGSFGQGGTHQVISMDHRDVEGDVSVLQANVRDDGGTATGASFAVAAGIERQRPLGGGTRLLVSMASHPELQSASGSGLQLLRVASTDKIVLGDSFIIDAGTLLTAERLLQTKFASAPYVRFEVRPSQNVTLEYRFATDRSLQRTEDLDGAALSEEALADAQGRPVLERRLHQEVAATLVADSSTLRVAAFHDDLPTESVLGGGLTQPAEGRGLAAITDPSTGTLRLTLPGLTASGVAVSYVASLSSGLSACLEGELGRALEADGPVLDAAALSSSLHPHVAGALATSVKWQDKRTGTTANLRYRWQPLRSLTQVDEFDSSAGDAYLSFRLRQRLWSGQRLKGISAVLEATNLLAQGYEPLISPDGETLYLAQVPRGVLGGLAFSF